MSTTDPVDVVVVGNNLNSYGFVGYNFNISGLGLNTFGFLYPCADIWTPADETATTTWTACETASNVEVCID